MRAYVPSHVHVLVTHLVEAIINVYLMYESVTRIYSGVDDIRRVTVSSQAVRQFGYLGNEIRSFPLPELIHE